MRPSRDVSHSDLVLLDQMIWDDQNESPPVPPKRDLVTSRQELTKLMGLLGLATNYTQVDAIWQMCGGSDQDQDDQDRDGLNTIRSKISSEMTELRDKYPAQSHRISYLMGKILDHFDYLSETYLRQFQTCPVQVQELIIEGTQTYRWQNVPSLLTLDLTQVSQITKMTFVGVSPVTDQIDDLWQFLLQCHHQGRLSKMFGTMKFTQRIHESPLLRYFDDQLAGLAYEMSNHHEARYDFNRGLVLINPRSQRRLLSDYLKTI